MVLGSQITDKKETLLTFRVFISVWRNPGQLGKISEKYPVSSGGSGGRSEGQMGGGGDGGDSTRGGHCIAD